MRRGVAAQFLQGSFCRLRHVVADFEAHFAGQLCQRQDDLLGLLGRNPPDEVVVGHEPVRVLQRDLGLADAAESVQGLGNDDCHAAARQLVAQQFQGATPPGEVGVPGRHIPDPRDRAGEAGFLGLRNRAREDLAGPVERPQQLRGRLAGIQPRQVDRGVVGKGLGDSNIADPDRDQLPVRARGVGGRHGLPDGPGIRRVQIGGREHRDGAGSGLKLTLGLQAGGGSAIPLCRRDHGAARQHAEARAGQDGLDPVGPHAVLWRVAQEHLGGREGRAPDEGIPVLQPADLRDGPHGRYLAASDSVTDPLERGEQRGR